MKTRHLRARFPEDEYMALQLAADKEGLTLSEHVRNHFLRDRKALAQEQFLLKIDAKLLSFRQSSASMAPSLDIEPLLAELLYLIRELVSERNVQVLGRVANQLNTLYPNRKKL